MLWRTTSATPRTSGSFVTFDISMHALLALLAIAMLVVAVAARGPSEGWSECTRLHSEAVCHHIMQE